MTTEKTSRQMPKGGRKGGSTFPRVSLNDAVGYARKLVSKTHASAQPQDVIFAGVVGARSGKGSVRISALRQYGFLKGDVKSCFFADDLAKAIAAAPPEELVDLYRRAVLKPVIFKRMFDTFQGDVVSTAKLKQRAAELKVHPDEAASCVGLYISGMTSAGLVSVDGDQVTHCASSDLAKVSLVSDEQGAGSEDIEDIDVDSANSESVETQPVRDEDNDGAANRASVGDGPVNTIVSGGATSSIPRAAFNVNVTLDSSLDIEKLQKQLQLLKDFGAI